jgi:hypothetical protein
LGGEFSQIFSVEHQIHGYGQNSLSISSQVQNGSYDSYFANNNFNTAVQNWQNAGNTFSEINSQGDPATFFYSNVHPGVYISTTTTTITNPWADGDEAGAEIMEDGGWFGVIAGFGLTGFSAYKCHSINELVSLQISGSPIISVVNSVSAQAQQNIQNAISNTSETIQSETTTNVTGTDTSGNSENLTVANQSTNFTLFGDTNNGTAYNVFAVHGGTGQTYDSSETGQSPIIVDNSGGGNTFNITGSQFYVAGASSPVITGTGSGIFETPGMTGVLYVTGGSNNITVTQGGTMAIYGTNETVVGDNSTSDTVNLNTNSSATILNGQALNYPQGAVGICGTNIQLTATDQQITAVSNGQFSLNSGSIANTVTLSTGAQLQNSGTQGDIFENGNNYIATYTNQNTFQNNVSGDLLNFTSNTTNNLVYGIGGSIGVCGTNVSLSVAGTETINTIPNASFNIRAINCTFNLNSGTTGAIWGTGNTVNLSNGSASTNPIIISNNSGSGTNTIHQTSGSNYVQVESGTTANFTGGATSKINVGGAGNSAATSFSITLTGSGVGTTVDVSSGSSGTLNLGTTNSTVVLSPNDTVTVSGTGTVKLAANDHVTFNNGSGGDVIQYYESSDYLYGIYSNYGYGAGNSDGFYYYGYSGFYGFVAGSKGPAGQNIASIAHTDLVSGHLGAANAAESARQQANHEALAGPSSPGSSSVVLEGARWDQKVITWSIADSSGTAGSQFSSYMDPSYGTLISDAFGDWQQYMPGVKFEEVADGTDANIRIGFGTFDTAASGVIGYTSTSSTDGRLENAIVRIEDPNESPLSVDNSGTTVYNGTEVTPLQVLEHEIGHALGIGDNSDPTSIMDFQLGSSNRQLDMSDSAAANQLYGSGELAQIIAATAGSAALSSTTDQDAAGQRFLSGQVIPIAIAHRLHRAAS